MQAATRILVVEDERVIRDLFQSILEPEGYRVSTASSAGEALNLLRDETYDAAVLDLVLPDMNGILLFFEIRTHHPRLARKVFFLCDIGFGEETEQYLLGLGAGFITKPLDHKTLLRAVIKITNGSNRP